MTYLVDANLLIAFLDEHHIHHAHAHRWAARQTRGLRWATSPIVENAFVRITANPSYPNPYSSAAEALNALRDNFAEGEHVFWPDDISLCDHALWLESELLAPAHVGDLYLLALAVKHGGKLATFDRRIPAHLIRGGLEALHVLPA